MMEELTTYFDALFNKMNYSNEIENTKKQLMEILLDEYHTLLKEGTEESDIVGALIMKYGSVEKINTALHKQLMIESDFHHDIAFNKTFNKNKRSITIISFLVSLIVAIVFIFNVYNFIVLLSVQIISIFLIAFFYKKIIENTKHTYQNIELTRNTVDELQKKTIKVHRRLQYSIVAFITLVVLGLNSYLNLVSYSNLDWTEGLTYGHFSATSIGLYFLLKNALLLKEVTHIITAIHPLKKYTVKLLRYSGLFWFIYLLIQLVYYYFIYNDFTNKLMILSIFIYIITMCIYVRYQYKIKDTIAFKTKIKRIIIVGLIVLLGVNILLTRDFWALQPYISTIPRVNHKEHKITYNEDGSYSIYMNKEEEFNILQLTDIHLGGSFYTLAEDQNALTAVYDLIQDTKPDLVVITGDFVFSVGLFSLSLNNYTPMMQFASFMRNIGIPWAFVYGNHDTEGISSSNAGQINEMFEQFSYQNTGSLLYSAKKPDITGRYNQYIKIMNSDDTVNQVLFLLDSNEYIGSMKNYDYIRDDQVEWYKSVVQNISAQESKVVSSLLFFHIPIEEFKDAYTLYKNKDASVTYHFGEIGEKKEAISSSKHNSRLFEVASELKSTKGMFVGHDHYNNISLDYQGIQLTFSRSIDFLAMPGISKKSEQRGATRITLKPDSTINVESIKLSDIKR